MAFAEAPAALLNAAFGADLSPEEQGDIASHVAEHEWVEAMRSLAARGAMEESMYSVARNILDAANAGQGWDIVPADPLVTMPCSGWANITLNSHLTSSIADARISG